MQQKPTRKPVVFDIVNQCLNQRLTIKQNKTKQKEGGFRSLNENENRHTCLLVNLSSKAISLASSLCSQAKNARFRAFKSKFSTGFAQSFQQSQVFAGQAMSKGE